MTTIIPLELELPEAKLIEAFRSLPLKRRVDLLDKLRALNEPRLRMNSASRLYALTGLIALGGDAVADTEAIYDGDCRH